MQSFAFNCYFDEEFYFYLHEFRSNHRSCSVEVFLEISGKFTEKDLCQRPFLNKVADFFAEHLRTTASVNSNGKCCLYIYMYIVIINNIVAVFSPYLSAF